MRRSAGLITVAACLVGASGAHAQADRPSRPVRTIHASHARAMTGDVFTARVHGRRERIRVAWLNAPETAYAWQHLSFFVAGGVTLHVFGRTASGALLARVTRDRQRLTRAMVGIGAGTLGPLAWES